MTKYPQAMRSWAPWVAEHRAKRRETYGAADLAQMDEEARIEVHRRIAAFGDHPGKIITFRAPRPSATAWADAFPRGKSFDRGHNL